MIVVFVGYAQSGKDTAADALVADGFERRAFADSLRQLAVHLNPVVTDGWRYRDALESFGYEEAKASVPGFREFLKTLGQSVRDVLGPDTWANAALHDAPDGVVLSDCRFLNEAAAVRRRAGELGCEAFFVRVERPGVGPESTFEAEVPQISVDEVLRNDSSVPALHAAVRHIVHRSRELAS